MEHRCGTQQRLNGKYDAYYCPACLVWTELGCGDPGCVFCGPRPATPPVD